MTHFLRFDTLSYKNFLHTVINYSKCVIYYPIKIYQSKFPAVAIPEKSVEHVQYVNDVILVILLLTLNMFPTFL